MSACTRARYSSRKISLSSEHSSHFHSEMQTERRIWKASADESRSTIGADAAASGREAELERRPNGVSRSGAPFGKITIDERKRWDRLSEQSSRDGDKISSQYVIRCIKQFIDFHLLLPQGFGRTLLLNWSVTEIVCISTGIRVLQLE